MDPGLPRCFSGGLQLHDWDSGDGVGRWSALAAAWNGCVWSSLGPLSWWQWSCLL